MSTGLSQQFPNKKQESAESTSDYIWTNTNMAETYIHKEETARP